VRDQQGEEAHQRLAARAGLDLGQQRVLAARLARRERAAPPRARRRIERIEAVAVGRDQVREIARELPGQIAADAPRPARREVVGRDDPLDRRAQGRGLFFAEW